MTSEAPIYELPLCEDIEQLGLHLTEICIHVIDKKLSLHNARGPFEVPYDAEDLQKTVDNAKQALLDSHEFDDLPDRDAKLETFGILLKKRLFEFESQLLLSDKQRPTHTLTQKENTKVEAQVSQESPNTIKISVTNTKLALEERRANLKNIVSEYGLDIVAVYTAKKNDVNKKIKLFKEKRTDVIAKNLTTEDYIKKIDAGWYDDGYAVVCGVIRRGKYKGYKFILIDIDRKEGVEAFLDTSGKKITLEELADMQYIEFNSVDKDQRIHIPYLLEPDAEIAAKVADVKVGIEVSINGLMFGAGSPHHKGGFYAQLGIAGI
jgi:hypothetical protein